MKKVLLLMLVSVLLISFASSLELNPFAVRMSFEDTPKADTSQFVKEGLEESNVDLGLIDFRKTVFWVEGEKIAEQVLVKHNYDCFTNCTSEVKISTYQEGALFDDLEFFTPEGTTKYKPSSISLLEKESYYVDVPDTFKEVCTLGNNSQKICYQEAVTFKQEERFKDVWKPYTLGESKPAGDYTVIINVIKNPNEKLDFQYTSYNKRVTKYAWFNQSWGFWRLVNMSVSIGSTSNNTLAINISNMTFMRPDGCDLRFTDLDNITELKHAVETNVSGVYIIEYINVSQTVNTTNRGVLSMWFGNALASCTGNWSTAFTWGDDASINKTTSYTRRAVSGGSTVNLLWNSTGKNYFINESTGGFGVTFEPNPNISVSDNYRMGFRACVNTTSDQARVYFGITNATTNIAYQLTRGVRGDSGASKLTFEQTYNGAGANPNATNDIYADKCYWSMMNKNGAVYQFWDAYANDSSSLNLTSKGNYTNASITSPILSIATRKLDTVVRFSHLFYAPFYAGTLSYGFSNAVPLGITVLSEAPTSQTNFSSSTVYFTVNNSNPSGLFGLVNTSLYINGTLNATNFSGILGRTNFTGIALQEGYYNYTFYSYDNTSSIYPSSNGTLFFSVDLTNPTQTVNNPLFYNYTYVLPFNTTYSITTSDLHLGSCWYYTSENSVNITYTCNSPAQVNFTTAGNKTIYFWVNDTAGNYNYSIDNFYVNYLIVGTNFTRSTYEGSLENYYLNVTATNITNITGNFTWNGTTYSITNTSNGTYAVLNYSKLLAGFSTQTNITVRFNYTINTLTNSTANENQTINTLNTINVTNASGANCNTTSKVFYMMNEVNRTNLTGSSVNYVFHYGSSVNNTLKSAYGNLTGISNFKVCTDGTNYTIGYGEIQYSLSGYTDRRYYNFVNTTFNSVLVGEELYLLPNADATSFLFTFKDRKLNNYVGNYTALLRWYPDINSYDTVEMAKTDDKGQTIMRVKAEDVDYRTALYHINGTSITLINPVRFACLTSPCSYNVFVNTGENISNTGFQVTGEILYNSSTNIWTYAYNDPTQTTSSIRLLVRKEMGDSYYNICNNTGTGYTGVLTCDSTGYTGKLRGLVYRSASPQDIIEDKLIDTSVGLQGATGLLISVFFVAALLLIGIWSPIAVIIMGCVGLFLSYILGAVTLTVFIGMAVIGGIVIHFFKRT